MPRKRRPNRAELVDLALVIFGGSTEAWLDAKKSTRSFYMRLALAAINHLEEHPPRGLVKREEGEQ